MRYPHKRISNQRCSGIDKKKMRSDNFPVLDNRSGFTLIELMIVIAIFSILSAIAIPNSIAWRNNAQFNAAVRDVKGEIEKTRMTAIRSNLPADILFTNGTNTFNTRSWDRTTNSAGASVAHQLEPGITIKNTTFSSRAVAGQLSFNNRGMVVVPAGRVEIENTSGSCRAIFVSREGSSRIDECP